MKTDLQFGTENLNWEHVLQLIENRPRDKVKGDNYYDACKKIKTAFENSYLVCAVFVDSHLVGICRALSDGIRQSVVYDLNVKQTYQRRGLGETMMTAMLERLPDGPVILFAIPGREEYYERFGFQRLLTGMGKFPDTEKRQRLGFVP